VSRKSPLGKYPTAGSLGIMFPHLCGARRNTGEVTVPGGHLNRRDILLHQTSPREKEIEVLLAIDEEDETGSGRRKK